MRSWLRKAAIPWLALTAACAPLVPAPSTGSFFGRHSAEPDEARLAAALTEALELATQRALERTARDGGFRDHPRIRIRLPNELAGMVTALRTVGLGGQMNVLELAMNRAAERAAAEASPVFGQAIARLTIANAADVRRGPEDALTRTLRDQARPQLVERLTPIVDGAMRQVGLVQAYDQLMSRYSSLPDFGGLQFDLADYVTRETVDGLLVVLAEEERLIRSDPAARSGELLREVFGNAPPRGG